MTQFVNAQQRSRATTLLLVSLAFWLVFAVIATAAGITRELWLVRQLGELRAHQVGTLFVCAAFLAVIALFDTRIRPSPEEALAIGIGWLLAAVAFEFGFGHFVDGLSWSRLLSDYDISRGRLLLLVWLTVGGGPFVLARLYQHQR
jgi:hypothetical protein